MEKELRQLLVTVFLWGTSGFMVAPAITDVTMSALCPAEYQCSLAIYLTGFQQAITGVGAVVTTPLMGNLSDKYGRKALLTLPLTLSVFPLVILGYSRATNYFYAYYAVKTLTAIVGEGSVNCLALAYLADKVGERKRASAFGILGGVGSASFVCGTLASRFLSTALTFQVAALFAMSSAVYMRIFLEESLVVRGCVRQPMLKESGPPCVEEVSENSDSSPPIFKTLPSLRDLIGLLKCSPTFSKAAIVCFFNSLAEGGLQVSVLYYLKYRFQFSKNQFADLMLINGVGATLVQISTSYRGGKVAFNRPLCWQHHYFSLQLILGAMGSICLRSLHCPWSFGAPKCTLLSLVYLVKLVGLCMLISLVGCICV
ncbi:hippocampus abundant transcript-like protein 1 isoform X2 [Neltuma alba]|uniref:hippocampus abundant transcript-like protein 1 isoform X2 n=1 Tax=Neltuma alba TaxID=207710 RepID=UPI0010A476F8|nr:hippocampus abundant transcript-like protein 1 isoform X2 [Prosopis alba]